MDMLLRAQLEELLQKREPPCVSIYLPTHRGGPEVRQGPIRLKNLLREAETRLEARGMRRPEAERLLRPAARLVDDFGFWQQGGGDGLALFVAPSEFRRYPLPIPVGELVLVNDRYYVKPLLPLLASGERFYLLAVSQNDVRLFEGNRHALAQLSVPNVPRSLTDAVGRDFEQDGLQFHTRTPAGGPGERAAIFHGQGSGVDDRKTEIEQFLIQVDRAIIDALTDRRPPLVVAAVEYVIAIYREVSRYPNVLAGGVVGNPEKLTPEALHAKAWPAVEAALRQAERADAERFASLQGTGRATTRLEEIVPAVHDGRVETLFLARGEQRWGHFDAGSRAVEPHDRREPDDEDLLDLAAAAALATGATIHAVDPAAVPANAPAAAIFRY